MLYTREIMWSKKSLIDHTHPSRKILEIASFLRPPKNLQAMVRSIIEDKSGVGDQQQRSSTTVSSSSRCRAIIRVRFCSANYMGYVPDSGGDRAIGTFLVTKSDILERILGGSASRLCGSIIAKSSQPITWAALIIGI